MADKSSEAKEREEEEKLTEKKGNKLMEMKQPDCSKGENEVSGEYEDQTREELKKFLADDKLIGNSSSKSEDEALGEREPKHLKHVGDNKGGKTHKRTLCTCAMGYELSNQATSEAITVYAEGQPIHGQKKEITICFDSALQQDIFKVDLCYEECEDYEAIDLEGGLSINFEEQILKTDMPERMQLRKVPISKVEEGSVELELEAEWIYKHAFSKPPISKQERSADEREHPKGPGTVEKIRKALEFMRCQHLEVPFIAYYRKEYVSPDLSIDDLWRVYKYDEKWTQLQTRKNKLMRPFEKVIEYQSEKLTRNTTESIPENVRVLREEDVDRLRTVQSVEELNDLFNHFFLYYGADILAMQGAFRQKKREELRERNKYAAARNEQAEDMVSVEDVSDEATVIADILDEFRAVRQAKHNDLYFLCAKAGLDGLLRKYGLSPEHFAENLRDNYQRHEVEQYPSDPLDTASEYVSPQFPTSSEVLKAANYMMAVQIAREPLVRQCVRQTFYEKASINVTPTEFGTLYAYKSLKDKPVRELTGDEFLRLAIDKRKKLITITFQTESSSSSSSFSSNSPSYADEVKQLFQRKESSKLVHDWNEQRNEVINIALNKIIFPTLVKELKSKLMSEARECVLRSCCQQLYDWIKVAPYKIDFPDEDDDRDAKNAIRVMAISYDLDEAVFGCLVNRDGECTDHIRLEHILKRKNAWKEMDRAGKERDLSLLRNFIFSKRPHVIAVSGESREATMLIEDLKAITQTMVEDEQWPLINVELIDNRLSKVFANSGRGYTEFREYPILLREAISLARLIQDPLMEFSQLCNTDDEILCLSYHPLQDQLPKEELLEGLFIEFVNRVNEVGVDINRAINYPHTANLVQFVCGLGPRKGQALIKILKQNNQRLENRTQLVTTCHMGPKVFINCAGFIKIDTNSLGDSTESYVEVLDGSRVHPETYEWARKMAVDALEYDDEDANPAGAVEEILETPERLKDLDLDAFADELERQGFGNKRITLYDIRSELNHRYRDGRVPFQPPSPDNDPWADEQTMEYVMGEADSGVPFFADSKVYEPQLLFVWGRGERTTMVPNDLLPNFAQHPSFDLPISLVLMLKTPIDTYEGSELVYHAFILMTAGKEYFSLEKYNSGVVMQQSKNHDDVARYSLGEKRNTTSFMKQTVVVNKSIHDLLNFIHKENMLLQTYNPLLSNCQDLAHKVYEFLTKP